MQQHICTRIRTRKSSHEDERFAPCRRGAKLFRSPSAASCGGCSIGRGAGCTVPRLPLPPSALFPRASYGKFKQARFLEEGKFALQAFFLVRREPFATVPGPGSALHVGILRMARFRGVPAYLGGKFPKALPRQMPFHPGPCFRCVSLREVLSQPLSGSDLWRGPPSVFESRRQCVSISDACLLVSMHFGFHSFVAIPPSHSSSLHAHVLISQPLASPLPGDRHRPPPVLRPGDRGRGGG